MTINRLALGLDENVLFIGRQNIIRESRNIGITRRSHIEERFHQRTRLERMAFNPPAVCTNLCIRFSICHRRNAPNLFGTILAGRNILQPNLLGKAEHCKQ